MCRRLLITFLTVFFCNIIIAQQPKLMLPIGHTDKVFEARFSPNGKMVVTASKDKTVKIWDVETSHLLADLKGHTNPVSSARFSPDGKRIVSYSYDDKSNTNTVKIWNASTGEFIADLRGQFGILLSSVEFSKDNKNIITVSDSVSFWDAGTGKFIYSLQIEREKIPIKNSSGKIVGFTSDDIILFFSPDGKWIVVPRKDKSIILLNAKTGKKEHTFTGYTDIVRVVYFTPDGGKIVTASANETVIWDAVSWKIVKKIPGKIQGDQLFFTPDGQKIVTADYGPENKNASIWKADTRKFLNRKKGSRFISKSNDPDKAFGEQEQGVLVGEIVAASNDKIAAVLSTAIHKKFQLFSKNDKTALLWNIVNGTKTDSLKGHTAAINFIQFSGDGKKIVTASDDGTAKIWDADNGNLLADLRGHTFNSRAANFSPPDQDDAIGGKRIVTASDDGMLKIWDPSTGTLLDVLKGPADDIFSVKYSRDGKKIISASQDGDILIWDVASQKHIDLKETSTVRIDPTSEEDLDEVTNLVPPELSPDGTKVLAAIQTDTAIIYDATNGKLMFPLQKNPAKIKFAHFSPDGKKIVTGWTNMEMEAESSDTSCKVSDVKNGTIFFKIKSGDGNEHDAQFSPDSSKIIMVSFRTASVWDAENGKPLFKLQDDETGHASNGIALFSPDSKKIFTSDWHDSTASFWEAEKGKYLYDLKDKRDFTSAQFSPDGKKIITTSRDGGMEVWETETGSFLHKLIGHTDLINYAEFSPNSKQIVTTSRDNTSKIWDVTSGNCLYTFFAVDSADYLVVDKDNHYDGTEAARKLLYFIRDSEIISLEQLKAGLWIPGLVQRLNNGETIKEKSLEQLGVFGDVIPEIEATGSSDSEFTFSIKPGKGGVGDIFLYVNDIEVRRYNKGELKNNNGLFEMNVKKDSVKRYFVGDDDNWISAKVKTSDNKISSQEAKISIDKKPGSQSKIFPNLYAVMIGTSQYKEAPNNPNSIFATDMTLLYPAIDAKAISQTVERAAKKMLENDGKKHVFMYNLTTDISDSLKPVKQTIKRILDSIGKKAAADDILLIFLSGHGVLYETDERKQFYYLTADASSLTDEKAFPEVGISTDTLMEWIKLENIPANKRILILDACYSGQVINDLKKDIDRLKENSKLFILSASASNKSAFESNDYEHGYLSYALLKVIKKQPDILLNTKLNISRWFDAAAEEVKDIARKENNDQAPHIITVVDFNIGTVDSSVIQNIRLVNERPLFVASNFQNSDPDVIGDDRSFGNLVNEALKEIDTGAERKIEYSDVSAFTNAYTLAGKYTIKDNDVEVKFIIKKGREVIKRFDEPIKGIKDKLEELAKTVVEKAAEWVTANK